MSCTTSKNNQIKRIDGSTIEEKKLDSKIKALTQAAHVTGLAVSIFNDNSVVYQKTFGYSNIETKDTLDIDHIFYGASLSKKAQFGPRTKQLTDEYDDIELSYGLAWGLLKSDYGIGAFKEGHSEGFQHYSIIFPDKKIGILIMSNSDNAESTFKELLEFSIGDVFTPWRWENYVPHNNKQ